MRLRLDGKAVTKLNVGPYVFVVTDTSRKQNFRLKGPGVQQEHESQGHWADLVDREPAQGVYRFWSDARPRAKKRFTVG